MAESKKQSLKPEVAAKYEATENFLFGQKLVFPHYKVHGIAGKPLHELSLEEADKLVGAKALNGVLKLKDAPAKPAQGK